MDELLSGNQTKPLSIVPFFSWDCNKGSCVVSLSLLSRPLASLVKVFPTQPQGCTQVFITKVWKQRHDCPFVNFTGDFQRRLMRLQKIANQNAFFLPQTIYRLVGIFG
jgi:hypothetical protein